MNLVSCNGCFSIALILCGVFAEEPNPPEWPEETVRVFGPEDTNVGQTIADLTKSLNDRETGHFSNQRFAFMFKPGTYNIDILVGYYMQVLGLGEMADDVVFTGDRGVHCYAMDKRQHGAGSLDVFWRSGENFKNTAPETVWAVSQAAPLRRVHVGNDLTLHDKGAYASGGFMANLAVDGEIEFGSQQQWITRNSRLHTRREEAPSEFGGAWSIVFVGTQGAPSARSPRGRDESVAYTNVPVTPVIAEKPFITIGRDGRYSLQVPHVKWSTNNADLQQPASETSETIPFDKVFVANTGHTAKYIQTKLDAGLHVVLASGIFSLEQTLTIKHENQVLLGIGMATLLAPADGSPCVRVKSKVSGVRVAGLMLGASQVSDSNKSVQVSTLLEWGEPEADDIGNIANPGVMSDIFARVGGPDIIDVNVDIIIRVHSGRIIGDNLWLWRADHSKLRPGEKPQPGEEYHLVKMGEYPCKTGLEVNGNDVVMYGLFAEHTIEDLVIWNGNGGALYFFQSEMPYDVDQDTYGTHVGYRVKDTVDTHVAFGLGVYTYFRDHTVNPWTAIAAPSKDGVRFTNFFTRFLDGNGGIQHVLNDRGAPVNTDDRISRMHSSMLLRLPIPSPTPHPIIRYIVSHSPFSPVSIAIISMQSAILLGVVAYGYWKKKKILGQRVLPSSASRGVSLEDMPGEYLAAAAN